MSSGLARDMNGPYPPPLSRQHGFRNDRQNCGYFRSRRTYSMIRSVKWPLISEGGRELWPLLARYPGLFRLKVRLSGHTSELLSGQPGLPALMWRPWGPIPRLVVGGIHRGGVWQKMFGPFV